MIIYSYTSKQILIFSFILYFFASCTEEELPPNVKQKKFTIHSNETNFKYNVKIGSVHEIDNSKKYHIIYLLDGDDYFNECMQILYSEKEENIILIGIGYNQKNERGTDYSYPLDKEFKGESGGANHFINFFNKELIPKMAKDYNIKSLSKTIYGHSLGGYFALYVMMQNKFENPFDNAISVSPNLMWYESFIFNLELKSNQLKMLNNKSLYLSMGDIEGVGMNASYQAFVAQLKLNDYLNFNFLDEKYKNTSHRNSPIKGFREGLKIIK